MMHELMSIRVQFPILFPSAEVEANLPLPDSFVLPLMSERNPFEAGRGPMVPPPPMEGEHPMPPTVDNRMLPPPHHKRPERENGPKGKHHEGQNSGENGIKPGCKKGQNKNGRHLHQREEQDNEDRFEERFDDQMRPRDGKRRHHGCPMMKLGGIIYSVWGLVNAIFYFKNFKNFKNSVIAVEQFGKPAQKKKGKKGGKKNKKHSQVPVEESKEESKSFERASSSDEESPEPSMVAQPQVMQFHSIVPQQMVIP